LHLNPPRAKARSFTQYGPFEARRREKDRNREKKRTKRRGGDAVNRRNTSNDRGNR